MKLRKSTMAFLWYHWQYSSGASKNLRMPSTWYIDTLCKNFDAENISILPNSTVLDLYSNCSSWRCWIGSSQNRHNHVIRRSIFPCRGSFLRHISPNANPYRFSAVRIMTQARQRRINHVAMGHVSTKSRRSIRYSNNNCTQSNQPDNIHFIWVISAGR